MLAHGLLTERQRDFLDVGRVGHLATADRSGAPHLIPVCYAVEDQATNGATLYITINIIADLAVVFLVPRLRTTL